ncbi:SPI-2 type III secretion system effector PipB [Salmonella enterica subsp. salamae]|nr:SPI-2 type III secretion system effector PipB [Salmonella enterica subsp. salamae]ECJ2279652.1 SPI-2 type III secretion system effector PipB [Salmonella enterica subsp. salamae]HCC0887916.1 SPI-2 type III secretion system effector PipB [Salmonella enterica]
MTIIQATPENVARYLCAAGTGTKEAIKSATSPRGILQWLVNFFTCGGVRRCNEMYYKEAVEKLSTALLTVDISNFKEGTKIFLEDINGCSASFSYGGATENTDPVVTIEVSKGEKTTRSNIDAHTFEEVCRMLKLMNKYHIPHDGALLTEEGKLNLRKVSLTHQNLQGEDLHNVDASGADFYGSDFTDANLVGADLSCANLCAATLNGANMTDAQLVAATLISANMTHTILTRADLTCANMFRVDLTAAGLSDAVLINTNLKDAKLDKSELPLVKAATGAKLTGTQHVAANYDDEGLYPAPSPLLL